MRLRSLYTRLTLLLSILTIPLACQELWNPMAGEDSPSVALSVTEAVSAVRAHMVHLPSEPRPWDTSAVALEEAIVQGRGHATIAFKERTSPRLMSMVGWEKGRREAVSRAAIEAGLVLLEEHGVTVVRYNRLIGGVHALLPAGAASELRTAPLIDYIEPAHATARLAADAPPALVPRGEEEQVTPIGIEMINADAVWSSSDGSNIKIGIIDDGYDTAHVDIKELNSTSDQCRKISNDSLVAGCVFSGGWHGTFVGGVISAMHSNGEGVVGVVKGLQWDDFYFCQLANGESANVLVADCIDWLYTSGVSIINMSFELTATPTDVATAVAGAWSDGDEDGTILVAAAGNHWSGSGNPGVSYPARYDEVIAVSGVMPDYEIANGSSNCPAQGNDSTVVEWGHASNYGSQVELAAPFFTLSTALTPNDYDDQEYLYVCGTSFAAPHVAGAAALVWKDESSFTAGELRERLQQTADNLGSSTYYGYGLVDALAALDPPPPPDTISVSIQGPDEVPTNAGEMCSWSAYVSGANGAVSYEWEWDSQVVSTEDFYVSDESTEGTYWLQLTVEDTIFSDWDGRWVEVDDAHSCF